MRPKVLIVDDEEAIRSSMKMMFEYEGYDCVLAAGGEAGLKIAERERPDLIFLDVKMPQMDGLEVLKELKAGDVAWLFVQRPRPAGTFLARIEVEDGTQQ